MPATHYFTEENVYRAGIMAAHNGLPHLVPYELADHAAAYFAGHDQGMREKLEAAVQFRGEGEV